jgi:DNA-binding protein YbaB
MTAGSGGFGGSAQQAEQQVRAWAAGAAAKAQRYEQMQQQVAEITETDTSADGAVRVTVAASGVLTDLQLSGRAREREPDRLAAEILAGMRRAQGKLSARVAEVMAATVGEDEETVRSVVRSYQQRFPEQTEQGGRGSGGELRFELPEDDDPPPPSRRRRPPARDDEDDDFGGGSILR